MESECHRDGKYLLAGACGLHSCAMLFIVVIVIVIAIVIVVFVVVVAVVVSQLYVIAEIEQSINIRED